MKDPLVDTHCHLTLGKLASDADGAIDRARAAGVGRMLVVGINGSDCRSVLELVERRRGVYGILGIHPNETAKASEADWRTVRELAGRPEVVAIGESGLDLYWDESPFDVQRRWLERHVELALDLDKPLVLHIRDAYPECTELLETHARHGLRGVVHCFAGEAEEVAPFVEWGWPISFSGILTYSRAENVRGAARRTPLDQCLVETDAPYLAPRPRGGTNEPAFVVETARQLAEVKEVSFEELARRTTANAERVFGLEPWEEAA